MANLTRKNGTDFLKVAHEAGVRTHTLQEANEALSLLRNGKLTRAAVLLP